MVIESINWMAGGPQGSGVDSASTIFGRACGYGGLYVFGRREYHSNIKTMHSYFLQRISKQPTLANISDVNLLAAFDAETIVRHMGEVVSEGGIIVDSRDLEINVLKDIATFSEDYKNQIQDFMKENNIGETINDFLKYAKQKNIQVFRRSLYGLTQANWRKTRNRKNQFTFKNDKCLNNRRIFCVTKV